jgi:hypothetical protein
MRSLRYVLQTYTVGFCSLYVLHAHQVANSRNLDDATNAIKVKRGAAAAQLTWRAVLSRCSQILGPACKRNAGE